VKVWFQNRRTKHKRVRSDDDEGNEDEDELEEDEDELEDSSAEDNEDNENNSYLAAVSMQQNDKFLKSLANTNRTEDPTESLQQHHQDELKRGNSNKRKHGSNHEDTNNEVSDQASSNKNGKKMKNSYDDEDNSEQQNNKYFAVNSQFQNSASGSLTHSQQTQMMIYENLMKKNAAVVANAVQNFNSHHFQSSTPTF